LTVIKKLTLKGFKSFAKHTEIPFGTGFNCCLGANGSGKCVRGDTLVQLADGSLKQIRDIVEKGLNSNVIQKLDDGFVAYGSDTAIICLDTTTLKTVSKPVLAFVKRKAPEQLVKIKTRSGRQIVTTEYHPLFILDNEEIKSVNAEHLNKGIKIAVPRNFKIIPKSKVFYELIDMISAKDEVYVPYDKRFSDVLFKIKEKEGIGWKGISAKIGIRCNIIKGVLDKQAINFAYLVKILKYAGIDYDGIIKIVTYIKAKNQHKKYKIPWVNSKELARLLGYLIAEGRITKTNQVWFTSGTEEMVSDYVKIAKETLSITPTIKEYKPNCWDCLIFSGPIVKILEKFGMSFEGAGDKTLTNMFLEHSSEEELGSLLNGLYSGDGYVSKSSVEITTKSEKLATAIETVLLRLGVIFSSKHVIKVATNSNFRGIYKTIVITGVENCTNFFNHVKLAHHNKNKRLERLISLKPNSNIDLISVNNLVKKTATELKIKLKPTKSEFSRLSSYCYNQCTPSRYGINRLINELFAPVSQNQGLISQSLLKLETISTSDIFWDEIIGVEKINHNEEWVYDLCVDEHHNFIANNFFVHNSNIMDAMCFVLGKLSAKGMRAEKSANLIYNGAKKGTPAKEAECSIVFDNSNKSFSSISAPEVTLARRVNMAGNSVYKINDEVRTRQQVVDLLRTAGIEPDGHNIILQGDIVEFMEMKPEERRLLVEEISGISVWEDKKHKSLLELQSVDERLKEASIMLSEREAHLKELKKDRDQALKYKELEANVKDNKATWLHIRIKKKEEEKQELESKLNKQKQESEKIKNKITELTQLIAQKTEEVQKLTADMESKGDEERKKLSSEVITLRDGIARDEERLRTCKGEITKLAQRIQNLRKEMQEHDKKVDELDLQRIDWNKKIKSLTEEENKINDELKSFKQKHGIKDEGFDTKIDSLESEIEKKQQEFLKEQEEKTALIAKKTHLELQIKASEDKIRDMLNLKKEDQEKLNKLKGLRQDFSKTVKEISQREEKDAQYVSKLAEIMKKHADTVQELARLNMRQVTFQELSFGDLAIKRVLEMKKGIFGLVSDLGEAESKYSLALEIAAGTRIKSVVVDNDETAAKCIEYLKHNKLGVVSFLPLNKIKPAPQQPNIHELASKKGVVGLAVDLISYDPKFKDVFSYVFGNTLIVEDVETARKIGIGNARMVTLEGDVLETTGAMIGGFRTKRAGNFKEKSLSDTISKLNKEEANLKKQEEELHNLKLENDNDVWMLKSKKVTLEGEITTLERSIGIASNLSEIEKNKDQMAEQLRSIESQIKQSQSKADSHNADMQKLKEQRSQIREKLKQPEIAAGFESIDQKKQSISMGLIESRSEIKRLNEMIESHHKVEMKKLQEIIGVHEKEQKSFEEEINTLTGGLKSKGSDLKSKQSDEQKFFKELQAMYDKKAKLTEVIRKHETQLAREEEIVNSLNYKINQSTLDNAKLSGDMAGLNEQFKEFADAKIRRGIELSQLEYEMKQFDRMMKDMGNVNLRALEVYDEVSKKHQEVLEKKEKLKIEKEDVLNMMHEIDGKKQYSFMKTFKVLQQNFQQCYSQLTAKGEAFLEIENKENVFEGGVDIKVRLIGNRYLDIKSLSGGEKTLAALAFIFAIQEFNPASFYLLDEVDAALDKRNSELLSNLIKKYSDKAQYIVISHNDHVITEADLLYGVSMQDGVSKVVTLKV